MKYKKYVLFILCFLVMPISVSAKKIKVNFKDCIDGDTFSIINKNNDLQKIRLLAVDSPEIDKEEPYSKEAKEFTCNLLKNAKNIYIEYDENSDKEDKYGRILAWVFIDNELLEAKLVENGYAKIAYLYDDYKYTSGLYEFQKYAKDNKINIWGDKENSNKDVTKTKKKKEKLSLLDKINKYFDLVAIIIGMTLALITVSIKKKNKSKK